MKTLIWSLTALLATLWTGFIAVVHQLTGWLLSAIDTGSLQGAAGTVGGLALPPVPAWLEPWVDTASIAALQSFVVSLVEWLGAVMPSGDALMAWVGPLLWVGWAPGARADAGHRRPAALAGRARHGAADRSQAGGRMNASQRGIP